MIGEGICDLLWKKLKTWLSICATALLVVACSDNKDPNPEIIKDGSFLKIVGYLPEYRIGSLHTDMFEYCTDIIYFSIEPATDGSLILRESTLDDIQKLTQIRGSRDVRLLISIGGWGRSEYFGVMALSDSARQAFTINLTNFLLEQGLDGADIDWEFPSNASEQEAEMWLFRDLNEAFQEHGFLLTTAQSSWYNGHLKSLDYVDCIHIMSYDHSGRHSTYEDAIADVEVFKNKDIEKKRLFLGVPFYGRDLTDRTAYTYEQMISVYSLNPDQDEAGNIYFNNLTTIQRKTRYAINEDLGGIMIWELGQDARGEQSLLKAIYDEKMRKN